MANLREAAERVDKMLQEERFKDISRDLREAHAALKLAAIEASR